MAVPEREETDNYGDGDADVTETVQLTAPADREYFVVGGNVTFDKQMATEMIREFWGRE